MTRRLLWIQIIVVLAILSYGSLFIYETLKDTAIQKQEIKEENESSQFNPKHENIEISTYNYNSYDTYMISETNNEEDEFLITLNPENQKNPDIFDFYSPDGLDSNYILTLQSNNISYCIDQEKEKIKSQCYFNFPKEVYCHSHNLKLNLQAVEIIEIFDDKPLPHLDIAFKDNLFDIENCDNHRNLVNELRFSGITVELSTLDIFTSFYRSSISSSNLDDSCEGKWNDELVYFITRYDYVNVYHTILDLFVMWFTAQLYRIPSLNELQVIFFDAKVPGSLDHLWETFTDKKPLRITDIKENSTDSVICYRNSFFSCPSNNSRWFYFLKRPITLPDMNESELWMAFRKFIRKKFCKFSCLLSIFYPFLIIFI